MAETPEAQNAIDFHDRLAATWSEKYAKPSFRNRARELLSLLPQDALAGQAWLDAGCGTGNLSRMLAECNCRVTGVDASQEMIRETQRPKDWEPSGTPPEFQAIGSVESLPFPAASFDGVLCSSVVEYVPSPELAIREFHRVLRKDGLLLLSVPNRHAILRKLQKSALFLTRGLGLAPWPKYLMHSVNEYSRASLDTLLLNCGFEPLATRLYLPRFPKFVARITLCGTLLFVLAKKVESADGTRS